MKNGLAILAAAALLTACSSYRVVKITPNGGEVALQGSPDGAREKAAEYMSSRCPQGYDIVEEGEAVVGQDLQARTGTGLFGPTTYGSTSDRREWRIRYQCKGTQPAPAPQPATPAPATTAPPPAPQPSTPAPAPGGARNEHVPQQRVGEIHALIIRY
jgi:hypothetical protein